MTKIAILYSRVSKSIQKHGLGLDRQFQDQIRICESNGWSVSDQNTYQDIASAFHGKHLDGSLGVIIDAVEAGKINKDHVIVIESLDRLGRDYPMTALKRFIQIVDATDIYEVSTGMMYSADKQGFGVMVAIASFIMERAYNESLMKQKRAKSNWKQIQDKANSSTDFIAITKRTPAWITVDNDLYTLNDNQKYVREIFDMYLSGQGSTLIVDKMKELQAPVFGYKKEAEEWTIHRVDKVLKNAAAYGAMTNSKTKVVTEGRYPPVITKEEFDRVQAIKRSRNTSGSKQKKILNVLSGLTSCAICGYSYTHMNASSKKLADGKRTKKRILRCNHRASKGDCNNKQVSYDEILRVVLRNVKDFEYKSKVDTESLRMEITALTNDKQNIENLLVIDASNNAFINKFKDVISRLKVKQAELDKELMGRPDVSSMQYMLQSMVRENSTEELRILIQRQLQLILSDIKINALTKEVTFHYVDGRTPLVVSI